MSKQKPGPVQSLINYLDGLDLTPLDGGTGKITAEIERRIRAVAGSDTDASRFDASPDLIDFARRVAEHFEGTDSPLGQDAREAIANFERE